MDPVSMFRDQGLFTGGLPAATQATTAITSAPDMVWCQQSLRGTGVLIVNAVYN
jgi:hypothetical protein